MSESTSMAAETKANTWGILQVSHHNHFLLDPIKSRSPTATVEPTTLEELCGHCYILGTTKTAEGRPPKNSGVESGPQANRGDLQGTILGIQKA